MISSIAKSAGLCSHHHGPLYSITLIHLSSYPHQHLFPVLSHPQALQPCTSMHVFSASKYVLEHIRQIDVSFHCFTMKCLSIYCRIFFFLTMFCNCQSKSFLYLLLICSQVFYSFWCYCEAANFLYKRFTDHWYLYADLVSCFLAGQVY